MKIGDIIVTNESMPIKIEAIKESFITGREVGYISTCKWLTDFRICHFENIQQKQLTLF